MTQAPTPDESGERVSDGPSKNFIGSDEARQIARCVRGCATDDQYIELLWRIDRAFESRRSTDTRSEVRAAALEEAAKVCDAHAESWRKKHLHGKSDYGAYMEVEARSNAAAIRALSQSPPPTESK